ncbi:MAG: polysaccharide biosynthesis/export family protein [Gammaproteobacteria bacterium]
MDYKTIKRVVLGSLFFCVCSILSAADSEQYLIRQGDTLSISVWGDETLSHELRVLPDGSISFPLAGRVKVAGSNLSDVEQIITPLTGPMTVLQALSTAGGFNRFADQDAIKILRRTTEGYKILPVDYDNLLQGKDLNTNYELSADDTILVP